MWQDSGRGRAEPGALRSIPHSSNPWANELMREERLADVSEGAVSEGERPERLSGVSRYGAPVA